MDTETPGCSSSIKKKGMTAFQIIGSHIPMDIQSQLQMKTVRTRERYREEIGLKKKNDNLQNKIMWDPTRKGDKLNDPEQQHCLNS